MVRVNLRARYSITSVNEDTTEFSFNVKLKNGSDQELVVRIDQTPIEELPRVYNMAFGPLDADGEIDDVIVINHSDISKAISTVLFCAVTFLKNGNERFSIGIDGSNDARAYLYHRIFLTNKAILAKLVKTSGVDWYVRLLRCGEIDQDQYGRPNFKPKPERFDRDRPARDLYRYYVFR